MSLRKNRIFFISSWYPNRIQSTLGNFNEKFAQAAAINNDVFAMHVVADENMKKRYEVICENRMGVETLLLYFRKKKNENFVNRFVKYYRFLHFYFKLYRFAKKKFGKPDLFHLNVLYPVGIIALLFKFFFRINYVISEHWTIYLDSDMNNPSGFARFIGPVVAGKAKVLMPVTNDLKLAMQKYKLRGRFVIVPNVFENSFFKPVFDSKPGSKKQILHISSLLDDQKNITGILRVIRKLSEIRSDFMLHIVGDGDPVPYIEISKKSNLLNNTVKFSGRMNVEEISAVMAESDFFLLFSNYENLPCVIVEALATGLPIVSTNVGGISEHIDEEKGILVKPGDEDQLLHALIKMLDTYNNYDKIKLHQYALKHFSYESVGNQFTAVYNSILKN